jgi:Zn-dependent metalloprotease
MRRIVLDITLLGLLLISVSYAQDAEQLLRLEQFEADFTGKLAVQWDPHTRGPRRIVGTDIFLASRRIDHQNVANTASAFVARYADLLNVRGSEAKLEHVSSYNGKYFLCYQQYYREIPVWNARLRFTVSSKGQVLRISSEFYRNIDVSVTPNINLETAIDIAVREFTIGEDGKTENGVLTYIRTERTGIYSYAGPFGY